MAIGLDCGVFGVPAPSVFALGGPQNFSCVAPSGGLNILFLHAGPLRAFMHARELARGDPDRSWH